MVRGRRVVRVVRVPHDLTPKYPTLVASTVVPPGGQRTRYGVRYSLAFSHNSYSYPHILLVLPSSCRAPMLTHTHESRFQVPGDLSPRFSKASEGTCVVIHASNSKSVCRTLTGGAPIRCFVIYYLIWVVGALGPKSGVEHSGKKSGALPRCS